MAEYVDESALELDAEERQCYICLEVAEAGPGIDESSWVSPCRCSGTMAWVHQGCLLRWVRELEHQNNTPACGQCRTTFVLMPDKGPVCSFLDFFYKRVVPVCKGIAAFFVTVITVDAACVTIGVFALTQVYGMEQTFVMLMAYEDPMEAFSHLQLISSSLVFISYLPWQDYLLYVLRRSSERIPFLRTVLPENLPARFPEPPRKRSIRRILGDTVLLPVFAKLVGTVFFSFVESPLSRVLIGGVVYLAVECGLFMYLRQKSLKRQHLIQVLPVEQAEEVAHAH